MKKEKKIAKDRLFELNAVQFYKPTASDLHAQKNHLVRRVQRIEDRRYKQKIEEQKDKLKKYLKKLEEYDKLNGKSKMVKPKIFIGKFPVRVRTRIERKRRLKQLR